MNAAPAEAAPAPKAEAAPAKPAETKAEPASLHDNLAKKDAPKPVPDNEWPGAKDELPPNASPEAKKNFASMKEKFKNDWLAEKNARADLEKQLATYKTATPADSAAAQETAARLKAAEDRLLVLDLQSHPDFVRQYVEPRNKALADAKEVLSFSGKEGADLNGLLGKPLKDFNASVSELTKEMNTMDATTVQTALRQAYQLQNGEKTALTKANELQQSLQSRSAQAQRDAFEATAKEFTGGDFLSPLPVPEGVSAEEKSQIEAYNASLGTLRPAAEKYAFGKVDEKGVAVLAHKAATLDFVQQNVVPRLRSEFAKLRSDYTALAAAYEAVKGARSLNPSGGDNAAKPAPKTTKELFAGVFKH